MKPKARDVGVLFGPSHHTTLPSRTSRCSLLPYTPATTPTALQRASRRVQALSCWPQGPLGCAPPHTTVSPLLLLPKHPGSRGEMAQRLKTGWASARSCQAPAGNWRSRSVKWAPLLLVPETHLTPRSALIQPVNKHSGAPACSQHLCRRGSDPCWSSGRRWGWVGGA